MAKATDMVYPISIFGDDDDDWRRLWEGAEFDYVFENGESVGFFYPEQIH